MYLRRRCSWKSRQCALFDVETFHVWCVDSGRCDVCMECFVGCAFKRSLQLITGVGWPVLQRYSYTAVLIMYATNECSRVGYQVKRKRYERGAGKEEWKKEEERGKKGGRGRSLLTMIAITVVFPLQVVSSRPLSPLSLSSPCTPHSPLMRQRHISRSPSPSLPHTPPTSPLHKLWMSGSHVGTESGNVISKRRLELLDKCQTFSFDTSEDSDFTKFSKQPKFLRKK